MSGSNGGFNKGNPALTPGQITDALRRHDNGETWTALAAEFGVTVAALVYHQTKVAAPSIATDSQPTASPAAELHITPTDAPWQPPGPWVDDALCAQTDPESFFPEKGGSTREAKSTCRRCLVQAECLDYALAHNIRFGVWGGVSERERRRLLEQSTTAAPTNTPAA